MHDNLSISKRNHFCFTPNLKSQNQKMREKPQKLNKTSKWLNEKNILLFILKRRCQGIGQQQSDEWSSHTNTSFRFPGDLITIICTQSSRVAWIVWLLFLLVMGRKTRLLLFNMQIRLEKMKKTSTLLGKFEQSGCPMMTINEPSKWHKCAIFVNKPYFCHFPAKNIPN